MRDIDLRLALQQFGAEMGDRSDASGAEIDLSRIGAGIGDEFLQAVDAERGRDNYYFRNAHHDGEEREILLPIEGHLGKHERKSGERSGTRKTQRISIGGALGR